MSSDTQLWSDDRFWDTWKSWYATDSKAISFYRAALSIFQQARDEYEARIAELEQQLAEATGEE